MAQWLGQFTGLTHKTKAKDCEKLLRAAILAAAGAEKEQANGNKIRSIAKRLVSARRHLLKSQLMELEGCSADKTATNSVKISSLQARLEDLDEKGVSGILGEFGFTQA